MTSTQLLVAVLYLAPVAAGVILTLSAMRPDHPSERLAHTLTLYAIAAVGFAPFIIHVFTPVPTVSLDPLFGSNHGAAIAVVGDGPVIAAVANLVSIAILAFARRYLHRERGFVRFAVLCLVFVTGFDLVAVGASLDVILVGWELVGLASTFLIGFYGDRPSARRNAVFAFAAYRVADVGLLFAMVILHHDRGTMDIMSAQPLHHVSILATGLIIAAACKSSQFPLTALFARSMEGPTPTSALGYAGLSAHIGVVLLARTEMLWGQSLGARVALVTLGLVTAVHAQLVASTRADRKGVLGYATAGTVGTLFMLVGLGATKLALFAALGHATLRIIQVLRAPSVIMDAKRLAAALGGPPRRHEASMALYRLAWALRRFDHDLPELVLDVLSPLHKRSAGRARRRHELAPAAPVSQT